MERLLVLAIVLMAAGLGGAAGCSGDKRLRVRSSASAFRASISEVASGGGASRRRLRAWSPTNPSRLTSRNP